MWRKAQRYTTQHGLEIMILLLLLHVQSYPTKEYFAVAEKGNQPDIVVYEYPSLRPYRVLRGTRLEGNTFFFLFFFFFLTCVFPHY